VNKNSSVFLARDKDTQVFLYEKKPVWSEHLGIYHSDEGFHFRLSAERYNESDPPSSVPPTPTAPETGSPETAPPEGGVSVLANAESTVPRTEAEIAADSVSPPPVSVPPSLATVEASAPPPDVPPAPAGLVGPLPPDPFADLAAGECVELVVGASRFND